jgi:hypothetical protein
MANDWYALYTWAMERQQQFERDASRRRLPKLARDQQDEERILRLSPVLTMPSRHGSKPANEKQEVQERPA